MTTKPAGRPREFDRDRALRAAVRLFWQRGYAAASLDDLLGAMQIGRSSFYGSFGSKHALLLEALALYTDALYARMAAAAHAEARPEDAIRAVLGIAACTEQPRHSCFFVNATMELTPSDPAVRALGRRHLGRVDALLQALLRRTGMSGPQARRRTGALLALAAGAIALRKAGEPAARIGAVLDLVPCLLGPAPA